MSTQEALHAENAALRDALAREQRESARLRHNIEVLERMVYGPRTERRATDEPVDRLQQIIAQSWYWIGGYCAPSDVTTTEDTVSTASAAAFKRAVMIEHIG